VVLRRIERTETAKALQAGEFNLITQSVKNSVAAILDRPNIVMLKKVIDPIIPEMFLSAEIQELVKNVNIDARLNIQPAQIPTIAAQLIELFPVETLEDFVLCFKRGATGFYGSIFRLDAAVLIEWMRAYLEEKYQLIEAEAAKSKKEEIENKIDYRAYAERKAKEMQQPAGPPSNAKDNELERFKLDYMNNSEFQKKRAFQNKLFRASSEFYNTKGRTAGIELQQFENENGEVVPAESEEDAILIYNNATNGNTLANSGN
jgi:hypothetical protein